MHGTSLDRGLFIKNFRFDTICNINEESQEIERFTCASGFIGKSAVIKSIGVESYKFYLPS